MIYDYGLYLKSLVESSSGDRDVTYLLQARRSDGLPRFALFRTGEGENRPFEITSKGLTKPSLSGLKQTYADVAKFVSRKYQTSLSPTWKCVLWVLFSALATYIIHTPRHMWLEDSLLGAMVGIPPTVFVATMFTWGLFFPLGRRPVAYFEVTWDGYLDSGFREYIEASRPIFGENIFALIETGAQRSHGGFSTKQEVALVGYLSGSLYLITYRTPQRMEVPACYSDEDLVLA